MRANIGGTHGETADAKVFPPPPASNKNRTNSVREVGAVDPFFVLIRALLPSSEVLSLRICLSERTTSLTKHQGLKSWMEEE
jgi:hypothetical protein